MEKKSKRLGRINFGIDMTGGTSQGFTLEH